MTQHLSDPAFDDELQEILSVCVERAKLPIPLPHCAICARYATDSLAFSALLSFLDVLPEKLQSEAVAIAAEQLTDVPAPMRQVSVKATTLPVLLDSPGWPLVRSLVIDMAHQKIRGHFGDSRLTKIEEVTLLGFAYGGCEVDAEFSQAFFHSAAFSSLRTLLLHSVESTESLSSAFWSSLMARQLTRVEGMPYEGEPIDGPLAVEQLKLAGCFERPLEGFSLAGLLAPETTPNLKELSLSCGYSGLIGYLECLEKEGAFLERIESVELELHESEESDAGEFVNAGRLPSTFREVNLSRDFHHVSDFKIRSGCNSRKLYDSESEDPTDVRLFDEITDYSDLVFDWRFRDSISRRIQNLSLLLPLEIEINELLAFLQQLPELSKLSLIYPFNEKELEALVFAEQIRDLDSLTLELVVCGGRYDDRNDYMKENEGRYESQVSVRDLFAFAFGESVASVSNLTMNSRDFELTRSPDRIQHCELRTEAAVFALAERDPTQPIDLLAFDYDLPIHEPVARALTESSLLSRVYRLTVRDMDEAGASLFAACPQLASVRGLQFFAPRNSFEVTETVMQSPTLCGVWNVGLYLQDPRRQEGITELSAASPLLNRAVALEIHGPDDSPLIPQSGRLGRVRQLGEWIRMHVFGDSRLASVWRDHPLSRPLRAELEAFIEWTYRVSHKPDEQPELEKTLLALKPYEDKGRFKETLRDLLAVAFEGQPARDECVFVSLSPSQQSALTAISQMPGEWWNLGGIVNGLVKSYGLGFFGEKHIRKFIDEASVTVKESFAY